MYGLGIGNSGEQNTVQGSVKLPSSLLSPVVGVAPSYQDFEMGESLFKQGDFNGSILYLKRAKNRFMKEMNFSRYLDCYDMLFHAFFEQCREDELEDMKIEFEAICKKYNKKDIKTLSVIIFSSIDTRSWIEISKNLKEILHQVLKKEAENRRKNNRIQEFEARLEILFCLYTYVSYYYQTNQVYKCQKELKNVNIILEDYYHLEDQIREEKSRTDNAQDQKTLQELLWAYHKASFFVKEVEIRIKYMEALMEENCRKKEQLLLEILKKSKTVRNGSSDYLMGYIYTYLSQNYMELKDLDQAATFLKLAGKYTDFNNFKRLGQHIYLVRKELENLRNQSKLKKDYDIIFDRKHRSIVEKQKGCISFKNQHILWDIMDLLVSRPGVAFSKQKLVEKIWQQDYMPLVHDNKIYVTLKRLRELVEQNSQQPVYIRRNKEGYHLNEGARILIK